MLYTLHDGKALFIERWILQESFMLIREIDIYTSLAETWYLLELISMGLYHFTPNSVKYWLFRK